MTTLVIPGKIACSVRICALFERLIRQSYLCAFTQASYPLQPGLAGALPCRAVSSGGEFAGQPHQLLQVGEKLAGHLDAVREQLAEQFSCGHMSGLAGRVPGRLRGQEGLLGEELGGAAGCGDASGGCALAC